LRPAGAASGLGLLFSAGAVSCRSRLPEEFPPVTPEEAGRFSRLSLAGEAEEESPVFGRAD
jgi:hypothetical protein